MIDVSLQLRRRAIRLTLTGKIFNRLLIWLPPFKLHDHCNRMHEIMIMTTSELKVVAQYDFTISDMSSMISVAVYKKTSPLCSMNGC